VAQTFKDLKDAEKWLREICDVIEHPTKGLHKIFTEKQSDREGVAEYVSRVKNLFNSRYQGGCELVLVDLIWLGIRSEITKKF
jgi:hypothetical protein